MVRASALLWVCLASCAVAGEEPPLIPPEDITYTVVDKCRLHPYTDDISDTGLPMLCTEELVLVEVCEGVWLDVTGDLHSADTFDDVETALYDFFRICP